MKTDHNSEFAQIVYQIIASIPSGQVASYGQIAKLAGFPSHSRFVGRLMSQLPKDTQLPWWRVVKGNRELGLIGNGAKTQQEKLLLENIPFIRGKIPKKYFLI